MKKVIFFLLALFIAIPSLALATIGVGVGSGNITVDEPMKPGTIYQVPSITVINTGDEATNYEPDITFHAQQKEMWPDKEWFQFSPKRFYLEPGETQVVEIRLNLPVKAKPGDYFAFVEAHPVVEAESGVTRVNVAAAAKFNFTLAPSNIFSGIYYRVVTFFAWYAPWSYIVLAVVLVAILITIFRKKFKFKLKLDIDKKE